MGGAVSMPQGSTLLDHVAFRRLWLARILGQTAQNALIYVLMVIVIAKTGSAVHSSLLVLSFLISTVIFGSIAGVAADYLPKRLITVVVNLLRAAIGVGFFYWGGSVWAIYGLAFLFSSVGQFHATAESAAVPVLVPAERLAAANALFNLATIVGQVLGMAALAVLFLKTVGAGPLYVAVAALYAVAAVVTALVTGMDAKQGVQRRQRADVTLRGLRRAFTDAWHFLRTDITAYYAMVDLTLVSTAILIAAALVPRYMGDVLHTSVTNTVFVFAPAALGLLLGLRLAPWLAGLLGNPRVATLGFVIFAAALGALAFVAEMGAFWAAHNPAPGLPVDWVRGPSPTVIMATILAMPLGFAFSLVSVSGRAVLHERSPAHMRGRILAVQMVLAGVASVVPLFLVGVMTQLLGVRVVLVATVVSLVVTAVYARLRGALRLVPKGYGDAL